MLQTKKNFVSGMQRINWQDIQARNTVIVVKENRVHHRLKEAKRSNKGMVKMGKMASNDILFAPPLHGIRMRSCSVAINADFRCDGMPLPVIKLQMQTAV